MSTLINGKFHFAPIRGNDGKINPEACAEYARKMAAEYALIDDPETIKLSEAALNIWDDPKYTNLHHINTLALARMALDALKVIPDNNPVKEAARKLKLIFAGRSDKFLVSGGRDTEIYHKGRCSKEELEKAEKQ